jgi:hypothetical protein
MEEQKRLNFNLELTPANAIIITSKEDEKTPDCFVFSYFYDGDEVLEPILQLTLDNVPKGCEGYRRFGKEFMMYEVDIKNIKKDFPDKEVSDVFHRCGEGNQLLIDKGIPMELMIQKDYLKPLDIVCLEYG